jgi:hypothetical protein
VRGPTCIFRANLTPFSLQAIDERNGALEPRIRGAMKRLSNHLVHTMLNQAFEEVKRHQGALPD